jgi:HSP20 family molecular chaperone IbpA
LDIEVANQNLFVFQKMEFETQMVVPYMLKRLSLPADVDYERISAVYENGQLQVYLPFNELADGYHRHIDIQKN